MDIRSSFSRLPREGKIGVVAGVVFFLYLIFGFLIAPVILKSVVVSNIEENLHRKANLARIRVNPLTLSLTAAGFEMYDLDGMQFVGFDEFHVNFQISSIFRRAYTFDEIRLVSPRAHVKVLSDGSLNFSDLLAMSGGPSPESGPEPGEEIKLPQVLIFELMITQGRFAFTDLSRPMPFETTFFPIRIALNDFSTRTDSENPYAFTASTEEREVFGWEGSFFVDPLRSEGSFRLNNIKARNLWEYFQHELQFEVTEGAISIAGDYDAEISGETPRFRLLDCDLKLDSLKLAEKGGKAQVMSFPASSINGVSIDFKNKHATFSSINSSDAQIEMWLAPDGTLNLQELFEMPDAEVEEGPESPVDEEPKADAGEWVVDIEEVAIENFKVAFEDRTPDEPVQISLHPIGAILKNISNREGSQADVVLELKVNESGSVAVEGSASALPPLADLSLSVSSIALKPFNSYVNSVADLDIQAGELNLDGRAIYKAQPVDGTMIRYEGGMSIENFEAISRMYSDDFLHWKSLSLNDMILEIEPNSLHIPEVVAKEPYARVTIWPDGSVNLSKVFSPENAKETGTPQAETKAAMPIKVDTVSIENGSANFADMMIKPNFATGIKGLNGTIKGLSSESLARADVSLEGKVDEYAPAKIAGQINPLSEDVYTDLAMEFKNIELTSFNPYSGKFAGYAIEKGKLSLNLNYKVSEQILIGENNIVLDQLTLGERVENPDATNLPIGLAIALLKDRNGVIDIDLPIRGDLSDPEFSYGHIIFKALLNLIAKAATSPFAMLGGLIGSGGEELSFVEFGFGSAELQPQEAGKLDALAKALLERPALALEIRGAADTEHDRLALAEAKLLEQLKLAKVNESRRRNKATVVPPDMVLLDEDYERLLLEAYYEKYDEDPQDLLLGEPETPIIGEGQAPESAQPAASPESGGPGSAFANVGRQLTESVQGLLGFRSSARDRAMRDLEETPEKFGILIQRARHRLAGDIPVDEAELRQLAQTRSNNIKGYLIETGGIPNESLYIIDALVDRVSGGNEMRVDLALSGR